MGFPPKSEYPGEARPGTLPNSYFMTGRPGAFLTVLVLLAIFHPRSDILSGFAVSLSAARPRSPERESEMTLVSPTPPSPPPPPPPRRHPAAPLDVCTRFYDVCHPRGPLLLFITTDGDVRGANPPGLMKLTDEFRACYCAQTPAASFSSPRPWRVRERGKISREENEPLKSRNSLQQHRLSDNRS